MISCFTPFQLVSLEEMLFGPSAFIFYSTGGFMRGLSDTLDLMAKHGNKDYREMPDFQNAIEGLQERCRDVRSVFVDLGLSVKLLDRFVKIKPEDYRLTDFENVINEMYRRCQDELEEVNFLYVPSEKAAVYLDKHFLGQIVYETFQPVRREVAEAGKCYALGRNTACVFHLMRVVEFGAKKMVTEMRASKHITETVFVNGQKKVVKKPLDLCDWDRLIKGLNAALKEMKVGTSTNSKKKAKYSHYSRMVNRFERFKDGWRNNISHSHPVGKNRNLYESGETQDIINHARSFMEQLAEGY